MNDSQKNSATYSHIDGANTAVKYAHGFIHSVARMNTSTAPQIAVAL